MHPYLRLLIVSIFAFVIFVSALDAQEENNSRLVQFTGLVLDGSEEELYPVPLATVSVKGSTRGVYADYDGFFSIVIEKGDTVVFSAIGYKTVEFNVPDTLDESRYSIVQLMTRDTINLPEAVIFPWPSKEHFRLEFLAMDVSSELHERAMENLADETLARLRQNLPTDGNENADMYLRQQARSNYYIGQVPPMNIFNPIAWKKFFDAWKNGDFKRKKEN